MQNSVEQWAAFFYIGGAVGIVSALEFAVLGSADLQPWGVKSSNFAGAVTYGAACDPSLPPSETTFNHVESDVNLNL